MTAGDQQQHEREPRQLVYVSAPTTTRCPVCGFALDVPGEAVRYLGGLAHPACVSDSPIAMRGGA